MRRKHGLGAIQKQQQHLALCREKGEELARDQIATLTNQIDQFKVNLQEFAAKHKRDIKNNAQFRRKFQEMCAYIGVDPLQSSNNFWTKMLGVGDFYYELGIQVIEICMASSKNNGGIMRLSELTSRIKLSRRKNKDEEIKINSDDVLKSISKLYMLGGGLRVIQLNKGGHPDNYIIESVARELSCDDTALLILAQSQNGKIDFAIVSASLNWDQNRYIKITDALVMEGVLWIDQIDHSHWFSGLFSIDI